MNRKFAQKDFSFVFENSRVGSDWDSYLHLYSAFEVGKGPEVWENIANHYENEIPFRLFMVGVKGFLKIDKTRAGIMCSDWLRSGKCTCQAEWDQVARLYCVQVLESPQAGIEYLRSLVSQYSVDNVISELQAQLRPKVQEPIVNGDIPNQRAEILMPKLILMWKRLLDIPIVIKGCFSIAFLLFIVQRMLLFKFGAAWAKITTKRIWKALQLAANPKF